VTPALIAQDPAKVAAAHYKVAFENPSVRVLRVSMPVGGKSAMHAHPDHLAVFLREGQATFTGPDGKAQEVKAENETATYVPAGSHSVVNTGKTPVDVVVVEFKAKEPGTATLPDTRDNLAMKMLAEGPRAMVYRATADEKFSEPAGSKHDFDQVVIALGAAQMMLSIDGKPTKSKWMRGEAVFIPRGVAHESKNTGGKPVDFIIVAIK
jgi:oxalate decarboxylase/phosphoglucose isomerase-like protein (cupin superfamily)